MAPPAADDLIDFDIIENQKENIQSLPSGRSAKALVGLFSPTPQGKTPTPSQTQDLNDGIRADFERELLAIDEHDDPLDIYDRYVRWTLDAHPSAQATAQSQLRPLLERATKAFLSSGQYRNDARYLKLWLHYIRFFADTPRETYLFLARNSVGDELALFYEEFAAWLEANGRWAQAEEVYSLGIDKSARPLERLVRKYAEFQTRFQARPQGSEGPSSPALPIIRPALAAKIDPFASSTPTPTPDPQAQGSRQNPTSKTKKSKMAIFSDAEAEPKLDLGSAGPKGWESLGSVTDRRKENAVEAKPWAGQTMRQAKRTGGEPKIAVFKDEVSA